MCVLLKLKSFRSHATHQTCLRPGWLQNAEQVGALVNIFSSMVLQLCGIGSQVLPVTKREERKSFPALLKTFLLKQHESVIPHGPISLNM